MLLLRRVEVAGKTRLPKGRPVLVVANHFNGFVDPLVIATALVASSVTPMQERSGPSETVSLIGVGRLRNGRLPRRCGSACAPGVTGSSG